MPDSKAKPDGTIGAEYAGPGPSYMLPTLIGRVKHDPRSEHACSPAYAFGKRTKNGAEGCGPGPCYFPDSKMSRTGRDGSPRYLNL